MQPIVIKKEKAKKKKKMYTVFYHTMKIDWNRIMVLILSMYFPKFKGTRNN